MEELLQQVDGEDLVRARFGLEDDMPPELRAKVAAQNKYLLLAGYRKNKQ
jgi:hypothetical protein